MTLTTPDSDGSGMGHKLGSFFIGLSLAAITGAGLVFGAFATMFAIVVCQSGGAM